MAVFLGGWAEAGEGMQALAILSRPKPRLAWYRAATPGKPFKSPFNEVRMYHDDMRWEMFTLPGAWPS